MVQLKLAHVFKDNDPLGDDVVFMTGCPLETGWDDGGIATLTLIHDDTADQVKAALAGMGIRVLTDEEHTEIQQKRQETAVRMSVYLWQVIYENYDYRLTPFR